VTGTKLDAPAFHRNVRPILETLRPLFEAASGNVLEIGCGSGQHAVAFAAAFPHLTFWPTDPDARHRESADAWRIEAGLANLKPATDLDATAPDWRLGTAHRPPETLAVIHAFNVIHIAPWRVAEGLLAGAGRHLDPGGCLVLYGPFMRNGRHTAESNAQFDQSLRARDPAWGVRDLEDVVALAEASGLVSEAIHEMPANNLTVVFRRLGAA